MIVVGSRGSELALAQSRQVAEAVAARTGEEWRIEIIKTKGDAILDRPLPEVGGKGLFTEELEIALREGRIDVAVHSLKDLPVEQPEGLALGAVPQREDPADVLVFDPAHEDPEGGSVPLLEGRRIGSSSPRRRAALLRVRPDLVVDDIRGNVETRAGKVTRGDYAATMLAAAGLARLGFDVTPLHRVSLPVDRFVPAPGQGALGLQCRADDKRVRTLLQSVHDEASARCVTAERAVLLGLGGGCSMPLGVLVRPRAEGGYRLVAGLYGVRGTPVHAVFVEREGNDPDELARAAITELQPLVGEPLTDRRLALVRPGGADSRIEAQLAVAGAHVDSVAVSEVLPLPLSDAAAPALSSNCAIAFTSARAVDRLCEEASLAGIDLRGRPLFAVGPATREALRSRGLDAEGPREGAGGGSALGSFIAGVVPSGSTVLFPCAREHHDGLAVELRRAGVNLVAAPVYRVEPLAGVEWPSDRYDALVYTSPSAVTAAERLGPPTARVVVAIGATTAEALGELGISAVTAKAPTPEGIRDALIEKLGRRPGTP
jgi:hydroxymethylbilane synthase